MGKEYEKLENHKLFDCIECGACSFVCPSSIPLVQYYRASKAEVLQARKDLAKSDHARLRYEARDERLERESLEKEAKRKARKEAAEERARQAAAAGNEAEADPIQAAIDRARAKKAAAQQAASDQPPTGETPPADAAQLAIAKAMAARAAGSGQSPLEKAAANLKRLQERLAKSETKLQQSLAADADDTIINALTG